MEINSVEDIKGLCRVCLDYPKDSLSLWDVTQIEEMGEQRQLSEMLADCASLKVVEDDALSEIMCTDCVALLISAYTFKQRSIQSNQCLNEILRAFSEDIELSPNHSDSKDDIKPDVSMLRAIETNIPIEKFEAESFPCEKCDESFETKILLNQHIDEKHNLRCVDCLQLFDNSTDLSEHTCERFECDECLESFDSEVELRNHNIEVHKEPDLDCDLCAVKFGIKNELLEHFQNHIASAIYFDFTIEDQRYACFACDTKNIKDESALSKHLTEHKVYTCNACKEVFVDLQNLKQHMALHGVGSFMCQHCLLTFQRKEHVLTHLKDHYKLVPKSSYGCPICDVTVPTRPDLKLHIKTHANELTFCGICDETFESFIDLRRHKHNAHLKGCLCPVCGIQFTDAKTVDKHVKYAHSEPTSHKCETCNKSFRFRISLNAHRKTHNAIKEFACPFCSHRSHAKKDMQMHVRIHTNEKPYKCMVEGCDRTFKTSSHQKQHHRMHTGEKPHECKICFRRFREASLLKNHLMVHNNSRDYACDVCGRNFRRKHEVKRHKENVHYKVKDSDANVD